MLKRKAQLPNPLAAERQNAIRTLYANLGFMGIDESLRTLVVTSSIPNEGKSTVAVELSFAMAASGKRTLLIECDLRRRSLAGRLNVHAPAGLCAVVLGEVEPERAVMATRQPNLHFLDAEAGIASPADILDSERFRSLVRFFAARFDYVVIDTPPVGTFVDAAVVGALVDATLLVVREGFVERESVLHAADQLRKSGANLVGVVMNCCEGISSAYAQ